MEEIKPILEDILNDAANCAKEVRACGEKRIKDMYEDFERKKAESARECRKSLNYEIERMYDECLRKNEQLLKNARLAAKSEAVREAAFGGCRKIAEMPDAEYTKFLKCVYENVCGVENGKIYLNEKDKKRGAAKAFCGGEIAEENLDICGGFVLDTGKVRYMCTLCELAEESHGEICDEVIKIYSQKKGRDDT